VVTSPAQRRFLAALIMFLVNPAPANGGDATSRPSASSAWF